MSDNLRFQLEEFKDMRHNAFIAALELKNAGKNIAGIYGVNVPRELLWAMDIIPINIFGIDGSNIKAAEKVLDKNLCSVIKSSYGYVITDKCPFSHFADIVVGTNYCPDKESMLHMLEDIKPVYIIKEKKDVGDLALEYKKFGNYLQQKFNTAINKDKFLYVINKTNEISKLIIEITNIYMTHPNILSAGDLISIVYGSQFIFNLDERLNKLYNLKKSLIEFAVEQETVNASKVLITGAPMAPLNEEIFEPMRALKNAIVVFSQCEGENYCIADYDKNIYYTLAKKYLFENSLEYTKKIIEKYNIAVLVEAAARGCYVHNECCEASGLPCLKITVDYDKTEEDNIIRLKEFISDHNNID
ncbi:MULTISPECIES: 2-hydroxyacyl-CoA dehydratase family protein [unclassified Sedimentibacter]|uniref:2-hydroxyacyl-CoA dehydratase family protein n=1 Tax=unclassified Sedimentibacter TaxID=2649220 RepID=UPI0027E05B55|nr:2-hydroxyacyl-CoA dehydratase family protein [Sedimentibacter sp. MB35-C1]WMJ76173.1 2-hydroxyacyl-CoA dehydratase family protein [Sedimentibacter sp. MB35-C1]